jgi:hypothetical protein
MNKLNQLLVVSGVALTVAFSGASVLAQGGGGGFGGGGGGGGMFGDPAAMAQQQATAMRPDLSVTNDDEWAVILPRLVKVVQLQAEVRMAGIVNLMRSRMGGRGGGGGGRGMAAFMGEPDPASAALTTALDGNAPIAEVKAAMAKVREARSKKLAEMTKAQEALKTVISVRQEAVLLNNGILD